MVYHQIGYSGFTKRTMCIISEEGHYFGHNCNNWMNFSNKFEGSDWKSIKGHKIEPCCETYTISSSGSKSWVVGRQEIFRRSLGKSYEQIELI